MDQNALLKLLQERGLGSDSGLWDPPAPQAQPMLPMGGTGVDIARALQAALSQMQPPRGREGAGSALLRGAATGFSAATLGREGAKQTENEARKQANEKAEASYTLAAREMRRRRADLEAERRKPQGERAAMVDIPGVGRVPATSGVGGDYLRSTGKVPSPPSASAEARAQAKADEDGIAEQLADDIAHFRTEPNISMSGRSAQFGGKVRNRVNQILRAEKSPYDFDQLTRLARQQASFQGNTANSQRFSQLRQSAQTVRQHLDQFSEFFDKYEKRVNPKDVRLVGRGLFGAAKAGFLGADAAADATALEVTSEALGKEIAVVLRGGFAPFEQDIRDADSMVAGYLGPKSNKARIRALKGLLKARIRNAVEATPFAGGKKNPYLLEPSPLEGWSDDAAPAAGAVRGNLPPGAVEDN